MKIAIVGGSNSVLKESYANTLSAAVQIDNKAIGMTNSMYALLQMEKYKLLQHNDILIHEYFVNDNNHFFQGINSPERTKKILLTLIQQCMRNQKKLLLIMIYNRADKIAGKYSQSPIFTIYTDFIKQYMIPFIDMYHVLYTKVANQWPLYYKDDTHLSVAGMALLKDEVLKKLRTLPYLTPSIELTTAIYERLSVVSLVSPKPILATPTLATPTPILATPTLATPTLATHTLAKHIIKTLTNSLVTISYIVITDTITLTFDKPTEILAMEYVCDQRSGYIEIKGNSIIQKNTLKTDKLVLTDNKPIVACITFNVKQFEPATTYTITMIQPKDLHPSYYDRERNTYETLHDRQTNFKLASLLVTNNATF